VRIVMQKLKGFKKQKKSEKMFHFKFQPFGCSKTINKNVFKKSKVYHDPFLFLFVCMYLAKSKSKFLKIFFLL
jgi:hypothetical protein